MKILFVHNFYNSKTPSGENEVFKAEIELLKKNGHEIYTFTRHSDEIISQGIMGKIKGAISTPINPWMMSALKNKIKEISPDVVHVHNTFPLLSPIIFHAIPRGTASILTLHNYRLFCPAAIPMRQGNVCTKCIDKKSSLPAILHGCYRESRFATLPLALSTSLHRAIGTWKNKVDCFVALSEFQKNLMIQAGLPANKVMVKPNFYPGFPSVIPWQEREKYVVFAGRLTPEKGVRSLVSAWKLWGKSAPELRIIGDGELRLELEELAKGLPIKFYGQMEPNAAQRYIARARLQILPSEWFEGFPMVVREAFAFGTPAAVSNIGPLPSIVTHNHNGLVFEAANPSSLIDIVKKGWDDTDLMNRMSINSRQEFELKYTEQSNYRTLLDIYEQAKENSRTR